MSVPQLHERHDEHASAPSSPPSDNGSCLGPSPTPSASSSVTSVSSTIERSDAHPQKPLPLLPSSQSSRSVVFAPLPVTEHRERKHSLGMAGRARMLRERRERRYGGDMGGPSPRVDKLGFALPGDGTGAPGDHLHPPWQDDPLVKFGRKLAKTLRRKLSNRAMDEGDTSSTGAEGGGPAVATEPPATALPEPVAQAEHRAGAVSPASLQDAHAVARGSSAECLSADPRSTENGGTLSTDTGDGDAKAPTITPAHPPNAPLPTITISS